MSTTAERGQSVVTATISRHAYRPAPHPIVRIHLLGPMRATSYLGDDVLPRAKKARAALGYLCLAFGARVPRARIASMLWDRVSDAQARTSFRQVVSELTSAMGCLSSELISSGRATIRFNTDACWIDALALLESSQSDTQRSDLAVLCGGELLEGMEEISEPFGQWLINERIRFKERLKASLDIVLQQTDRPGFDPNQLVALARRLISFDPTHQGASRALMRALGKLGEREEALCEYERCRDALMKTSRVVPSVESERLYESLRAQLPRKGSAGNRRSTDLDRKYLNFQTTLPGRHRLRVYAHSLAWKKEFNQAVQYFDRALRLNPNLASVWALSAATYCYIGEPEEALRRLSRHRELCPIDPYFSVYENIYVMAYTFKRDYERAVVVGRRVVRSVPEFINGYKPLIASLGHLGRREEATPYVDKLLSLEPDFTIEKFSKAYPFKLTEDRENYCKGLRLAGVPKR